MTAALPNSSILSTLSSDARRAPSLGRALCLIALATAGVLPAWTAAAAEPPAKRAVQTSYQRDQARCMHLRVHGERANCLSEASTAHQAGLPDAADSDPGRYARNAIERCKPLPDADRSDCLARMRGQGTTSGSVAGGGIYRELVTRESRSN